MICPGCGSEIQDDSAMCMHCGYVFDRERADAAYAREKEEYDRKMEEYNRQMQIYRQQMEEYNRQQQMIQDRQVQQPDGQMQKPDQQMQWQDWQAPQMYRPGTNAGGYQTGDTPAYNSGVQKDKKKQNTGLIVMIFATIAVVLIIILVLAVFLSGRRSGEGTDASGTGTEQTADGSTEENGREPSTGGNQTGAGNADYTVMVYMIGSNLESGDFYDNFGYYAGDGGYATMDLNQMAEADIGDNVNVILQTGGTDYWDNDYGMEENKVQRFELKDHTYQEVDDLGDFCMCHEDVLEDFLIWGRDNYPADKYIMIFWDHGCGYTTASFGYDTNADEDDTMQIDAISLAMKNSGIHFDLTVFNACLMGSVELAHALSPYSDYMIASEESIYTFGYYYTDWMTELSANPDISVIDLSKLIIDDFEKQYNTYNDWYNTYYGNSYVTDYYTYQLALIDTSEAGDVVENLGEMFRNADTTLYSKELTRFLEARDNCGDFSGTSTADIIEFCTNYGIEGSEDVIEEVKDCVIYMKSDIPYANGLSFYCPEGSEEGCYYYSYDGRVNLNAISYNAECIHFYDDVLSAYAGYACSDEIEDLGMSSYYNAELVSAYDDTYVDYASGTDFNLDYTYQDGRYVLDLGSDFQYVSFLEQRVGYDYQENTAIVLGSDFNIVEWNEDGKVDVTFPDEWLCVDGQIVCYVVTDHVTGQDGSVSMSGIIPFFFEGDYSRLYGMVIQWDSKTGINVRGYTEIDAASLSFVDGYMYQMYEGMKIEFCYGVVEHEGNQLKEETTTFTVLGDVHVYDGYGFSIEYRDIHEFREMLGSYKDTAKGYSYMKIFDVFGNEYATELVPEEQ